jgi:glycosyltransferase involved in cell wall biosynthesis
VEELNLQKHVSFVGFRSSVTPFYHLAELIVLPSLYEGMPLVAIEAGAAGCAMVATSVDGILEVVVNGETGLLVEPNSPSALAEGILRLLGNPEEAVRMGRSARARMESLFDQERQVTDTAQLYRKCLLDRCSLLQQ